MSEIPAEVQSWIGKIAVRGGRRVRRRARLHLHDLRLRRERQSALLGRRGRGRSSRAGRSRLRDAPESGLRPHHWVPGRTEAPLALAGPLRPQGDARATRRASRRTTRSPTASRCGRATASDRARSCAPSATTRPRSSARGRFWVIDVECLNQRGEWVGTDHDRLRLSEGRVMAAKYESLTDRSGQEGRYASAPLGRRVRDDDRARRAGEPRLAAHAPRQGLRDQPERHQGHLHEHAEPGRWFERYLSDWTGPTGRLGRIKFRMHDSVFPGDTMTLPGHGRERRDRRRRLQLGRGGARAEGGRETMTTFTARIALPSHRRGQPLEAPRRRLEALADPGDSRTRDEPDRTRCRKRKLPLEGIRILDLARLGPGPHSSQILADFGADIIWVEPPQQGRPRAHHAARDPPQHAQHRLEPQERRGPRGASASWWRPSTSSWRASGPASPSAWASTTSRCARSSPTSSASRSRASARKGPYSQVVGHDINYQSHGRDPAPDRRSRRPAPHPGQRHRRRRGRNRRGPRHLHRAARPGAHRRRAARRHGDGGHPADDDAAQRRRLRRDGESHRAAARRC